MPTNVSRSLRTSFRAQPLHFDWALDFERGENALACTYWRSRCKNGLIPSRADLVPKHMRKFMAHVGLIEIRAEGDEVDYFIRLAGSEWETIFGAMSGRILHEFLPPDIEARWRAAFDPVRRQAKPVRVTTQIAFASKRWLDCEMFIAPLGDHRQSVSMLLMCFVSWHSGSVGSN
jgi:hypothetical protein